VEDTVGIRWALSGLAVAALLLSSTTSALAAPPTFRPAQEVCEHSGGNFIPHADENFYHCEGGSLPYHAFVVGQPVCEHAYGGTFIVRPSGYLCTLP